MTDEELKELIERLKKYASSKGLRQDEIDDFSQEAAFRLYRGRKATFRQLYVDFLRKTYGNQRTPSGAKRSRQTLEYAEFDEECSRGNMGDGSSIGEDAGCIEKALETLSLSEAIAIADNDLVDDIFTKSRKSQLRKDAKKKIREYLEMQHAYHLMETEPLWISYIEI